MRTRIVLISILTIALPLFAEAAGAPKTFKELADTVFKIFASGIATLVAFGIVLYLWGIASNITKLSQGEVAQAYRQYVFWGIAIIFVMVSIFGIVRLIGTTIFNSSGESIPQQQQPSPSSLFFNS